MFGSTTCSLHGEPAHELACSMPCPWRCVWVPSILPACLRHLIYSPAARHCSSHRSHLTSTSCLLAMSSEVCSNIIHANKEGKKAHINTNMICVVHCLFCGTERNLSVRYPKARSEGDSLRNCSCIQIRQVESVPGEGIVG